MPATVSRRPGWISWALTALLTSIAACLSTTIAGPVDADYGLAGISAREPGTEDGRPVETEGVEVSPGALTLGAGLVWAGTDADGLWRLRPDRRAFERLDLPLPSPRVTALLAEEDALWIGTDQGVALLPLGDAE